MDHYNLSATDLAKALGVNRPEKVLNIIHGKNNPQYATLEMLLVAYPDVNANFLFGTDAHMLKSMKHDKAGIKEAIEILERHLGGVGV